jgi:hypothetical protein
MLHLTKLRCTLQSYAAPHRAMLHLTELCCTPLSYAVPHGAIQHPVNYSTPGELRSTLLSYPTPCELRCTLLSYAVRHRSYGAQTLRNEMMNDNLMRKYPWRLLVRTYKLSLIWASMQPFLSYNAPCELHYTLRAKLHPMSYTAPCDLRSTPLSWAVF